MCILVFASRFCERFPFILIGNRDEQLGRGTRHLRYDVRTGLIWAIDQLAGGSWMGIEPRSGRFAILTNCRRAAAAPLTRGSDDTSISDAAAPARTSDKGATKETPQRSHQVTGDWRGAAPLSHIRDYTTVVPVRPELRDPARPDAKTLSYDPPSSRGTIVKDFLLDGELPRETAGDSFPCPPHSPLTPPFYAGYNLLTSDTLRTVSATSSSSPSSPAVAYTTNRYGAQYRCPVTPGEVHVLQNSFLDNTLGEPISARLRERFESALQEVVMPLSESAAAAYSVTDVATKLADACLCDRHHFDIAQMMKNGETADAPAAAAAAAALNTTIHSTNPLLGFSAVEMQEFFGRDQSAASTSSSPSAPLHLSDGGAALLEMHLQASVLKTPLGGYGTRVQSMVLVERVAVTGAAAAEGAPPYAEVIYFCQRDISFSGEEQKHCVGAPWIVFRVDADGSFARISAGT
ncbi:hypothetical protein ABB37_06883 [Leptomonas pyrrhocoris]|uniref:Uncharacterized protein n=1 Tax=Leptomonas pyrrhocoris TaxID=157538 RepID=A0A0M9FWM8_LEPPY|nr:hypothetical protein ABB37_06883 [Leptomonas pyrrhocoris]KPA77493.1 hypothetical protein ABB37_06883 [Leptomonas pyrrhocoris]|eukprot:XP_015655932.1 hypothetical protein ABB37_06883 [Leptomonas pyrrhocoris]